jgi:hypothetical protein
VDSKFVDYEGVCLFSFFWLVKKKEASKRNCCKELIEICNSLEEI